MRDQETEIIRKFNPNAFDTLENTQFLSEGVFPYQKKDALRRPLLEPFRFWRKGK